MVTNGDYQRMPDRAGSSVLPQGGKVMELHQMSVQKLTEKIEQQEQLIAEMAVENAELREALSQLNGLFAQDGVGIVEPLEGFAKRPQDLKRCVEELIDKLAAKDAELERACSLLADALASPAKPSVCEECEKLRSRLANIRGWLESVLPEDIAVEAFREMPSPNDPVDIVRRHCQLDIEDQIR